VGEGLILQEVSQMNKCLSKLTITGLSVHMTQVHKESLGAIEHALPNRAGLEVEIFGMEGIPEDVVHAHRQRVAAQFAQSQGDQRGGLGNNGPGSQLANAAKKPKLENTSDLKKRLAEHKAKKAAEAASGHSGEASPSDPIVGQNQVYGQPSGFVSLRF
jgi:hypothetical protein